MTQKYLTEAFQELSILEEDVFDITDDGIAKAQDFVSSDNEMDFEEIIDPLAETEEELQDSYIGKVILDCSICQSKIYKDSEEVTMNEEETLVNVGEVCPYCQSSDGYKVIGQVAPYTKSEEPEVTTDDENAEVAVDEIDAEESEEDLDEAITSKKGRKKLDSMKEDFQQEYLQQLKNVLNNDLCQGKVVEFNAHPARATVYTIKEWAKENNKDIELIKCSTADINTITVKPNTIYVLDEFQRLDKASREQFKSIFKNGCAIALLYNNDISAVNEDLNNVQIETDNERITVTSEPKEPEIGDGEMIAPIEPETEAEFNSEENMEDEFQDIEIDEFDESNFDELGESYLRRTYENVKSYKTTSGSIKGNTLKLEGVITFKSGKQAKTNFVFESASVTKKGLVKFTGLNEQFAKGRKTFTLTGKVQKGNLIAESLTYNYRSKDAEGKSKRIYGRVVKR